LIAAEKHCTRPRAKGKPDGGTGGGTEIGGGRWLNRGRAPPRPATGVRRPAARPAAAGRGCCRG
jgi:hypothetical protein